MEILEAIRVRGVQLKAKSAHSHFVLYMRTPDSSDTTLGIVTFDLTPCCTILITRCCVLRGDAWYSLVMLVDRPTVPMWRPGDMIVAASEHQCHATKAERARCKYPQ